MALPKRKKPSKEQVLKLVDQLPPKEQEEIRLTLDRKARYKEWRKLVKSIAADHKGPHLSDEEILAEVKAAKLARRAKLAKDSN